MTRHTINNLQSWTREDLIDAVQALETEVERLEGFEPVEYQPDLSDEDIEALREFHRIEVEDGLVREVNDSDLFIVRFYSGMDGLWVDITEPVSKEEANRVWNDRTENGIKKTCHDHIDYYRIVPADTKMLFKMGWNGMMSRKEL